MTIIYEQARLIVNETDGLQSCFRAIQKELLHISILGAFKQLGLLSQLTFKGGTCVRLCYGGNRFSEDLVFYGGDVDRAYLIDQIPKAIDRLRQHGIPSSVKPPTTLSVGSHAVDRWWIRCITKEKEHGHRELVERIKIEIDNNPRPPPTHQRMMSSFMKHNTAVRPDLLTVAPLEDICADKLIAFPSSFVSRPDNPRYRDLWDIEYMSHHTKGDVFELLAEKMDSVGIDLGEYASQLQAVIDAMPDIINSPGYNNTLRRFLVPRDATSTLDNAEHRTYMVTQMQQVFETVMHRCVKREPSRQHVIAESLGR